jgi:hypothetical protein
MRSAQFCNIADGGEQQRGLRSAQKYFRCAQSEGCNILGLRELLHGQTSRLGRSSAPGQEGLERELTWRHLCKAFHKHVCGVHYRSVTTPGAGDLISTTASYPSRHRAM